MRNPKDEVGIYLERYEEATASESLSWCYFAFSVSNINEDVALEIGKRGVDYEIGSVEFGRL